MNRCKSIDAQLVDGNKDTGSTASQIYYLTHQILKLTSHLESHSEDYSSRRGLRKLLGRRKRLLISLSDKNTILYAKVVKTLGIRGLRKGSLND
uniref:Small ribosomal subunit protein uS15c n=2 Tax=Leptochilus TaxID=194890 RepID=A0A8K2ADW3_9MONI|nr:ribosomal protein S15 [Leptochilus hemionitideus]YP_010211750.1 ribosomal protein S15 [Leptochilus decurrens]AYW16836.1 ribosomal protein S15 [Leptochilus hemionitideus]UBI43197.1 ribosomal protein S15 [Leptochilus decurrens]